jgi:uncharacterized membrane protein
MRMNGERNDRDQKEKMEVVISNYLRLGVAISAIIIFAGLFMLFMVRNGGYSIGQYPSSVHGIIKGLFMFKPDALILSGLFLLILTPIFRVGVSIVLFYREKDYLYVIITSLVFVVLLLGLFLGKAFGD